MIGTMGLQVFGTFPLFEMHFLTLMIVYGLSAGDVINRHTLLVQSKDIEQVSFRQIQKETHTLNIKNTKIHFDTVKQICAIPGYYNEHEIKNEIRVLTELGNGHKNIVKMTGKEIQKTEKIKNILHKCVEYKIERYDSDLIDIFQFLKTIDNQFILEYFSSFQINQEELEDFLTYQLREYGHHPQKLKQNLNSVFSNYAIPVDVKMVVVNFIQNQNLKEIRLSAIIEITKQFLNDILNALVYLHEKGYAHSNINPASIMYDNVEKKFVLVNFELAMLDNENQKTDLMNLGLIIQPIIQLIHSSILGKSRFSQMYNSMKLSQKLKLTIKNMEDLMNQLINNEISAQDALNHMFTRESVGSK
eukprot:NODE_151_length_15465_cov_0.405376.p5 type:complete len:360 gc:universal NODE_151_length_15465_cov_0.405376:6753-5674(-)